MTPEIEITQPYNLSEHIAHRALNGKIEAEEQFVPEEYVLRYQNYVNLLLGDRSTAITAGVGLIKTVFESQLPSVPINTATEIYGECAPDAMIASHQTQDFLRKAEEITREHQTAIQLAKYKGITPDQMFIDDTLYAELVRTTYTLEEYATTRAERMQRVFSELPANMVELLERKVNLLKDESGDLFYEDDDPYYLFMLSPEFSREDKIDLMNRAAMPLIKRISADGFQRDIERYWGEEAYFDLPESVKDWIANT